MQNPDHSWPVNLAWRWQHTAPDSRPIHRPQVTGVVYCIDSNYDRLGKPRPINLIQIVGISFADSNRYFAQLFLHTTSAVACGYVGFGSESLAEFRK